jgi:hypothetical protein
LIESAPKNEAAGGGEGFGGYPQEDLAATWKT